MSTKAIVLILVRGNLSFDGNTALFSFFIVTWIESSPDHSLCVLVLYSTRVLNKLYVGVTMYHCC